MLAIPAVVQRVAFPVLAAVGTVLGKYRKYRDAPEPVRRWTTPAPNDYGIGNGSWP